MNTSVSLPPSQTPTEPVLSGFRILLVGAGIIFGLWWFAQIGSKQATLFAIGLGLGAALYYSAFGFSAAYRNAIVRKNMSGVLAQIIMIGLATALFAPILADGQASGAWAPVGVQVAIGSFIFGIGMQIGGSCASGTLCTIGGGNLRMVITLIFFCIGAFIGSLSLGWWGQLPDWGTQSLGHIVGWQAAAVSQIILLGLIYLALRYLGRNHEQSGLWQQGLGIKNLLLGPWPIVLSAILLAVLNTLTLLNAGHPWTITWAFTLWGAKLMTTLGWDPSTSAFWSAPFQSDALNASIWQDNTSLMNIAVLLGAFGAAFASGKLSFSRNLPLKSLAASIIGGLLMGYGARLAYGCNIGALFSGMASTSLHAWLWIICAIGGTWIGIKLRPLFGLSR